MTLRLIVVLFLVGSILPGCYVWSETHGPSAGVGLEMTTEGDVELSPALELGYTYYKYKPSMSYGGGAAVNWSMLFGRVDFIANLTGHFMPLPPIPLSASFVASWSEVLGWALGFDLGPRFMWFHPHQACTEGAFTGEPTRPCAYTSLGMEDVLDPAWMPWFELRVSYRNSLTVEDSPPPETGDGGQEAVVSEEELVNGDPWSISFRWSTIVDAGLLTGRSPGSYDNVRWFEVRD